MLIDLCLRQRQSTRKSFNFDQTNKTCKQLESLDSNRTEDNDTNTSDGDDSSMAEIINSGDYREIFHSKRQCMDYLNRSFALYCLFLSSPLLLFFLFLCFAYNFDFGLSVPRTPPPLENGICHIHASDYT